MPFIPSSERPRVEDSGPQDVGELTYLIYKLCKEYVGPSPRYAKSAEAVAALECAKLEFYRGELGPYEAQKKRENGDV